MVDTYSENTPAVHEEIFCSLLRTPHRRVDETISSHLEQFNRDPRMYGKLAIWAVMKNGCVVRDICDVFIAVMFVSPYKEHRSAAWVMYQDLPPYRAVRVLNYVTGYTERVVYREGVDEPIVDGKFGVQVSKAKYGKNHHDANLRGKDIEPKTKVVTKEMSKHFARICSKRGVSVPSRVTVHNLSVKHNCLGKKSPNRFVKSAVEYYLRYRESNTSLMEGACLRAPNDLRSLYAKMHILPEDNEQGWVNQYLFHGIAPDGSRMEGMKMLIASEDPSEQAEIIMNYNLPFPTVASLVENITPTIMISFVETMTPQELLANMNLFKKHGALDNSELSKLIEKKISKIKNAKRGKVDAMKASVVAKSVEGLDAELAKVVEDVSDTQLSKYGKISRRTALLIDKSYSMSSAIELAKDLASSIAQAAVEDPYVVVFDTVPEEIKWDRSDGDITKRSAWDRKLAMYKAGGMTYLHLCVDLMMRNGYNPEQIVIVTDEGENGGSFHVKMKAFHKENGYFPDVVMVRFGSNSKVTENLKKIGVNVDVLQSDEADNISIPNILNILSRKSIFELTQEILSLDLPSKEKYIERKPLSKEVCV